MEFFMFTIFEISWFLSAPGSVLQAQAKILKKILNLSINSINLKMSIYLSISKMCSSLFSRGNQGARITNAKRTTQSRDAPLSANLYRRNALDLWTGALSLATSSLLWKQQWNSWHLLRNNEHIFPDFMDITVWIWMKLMPKLTLYFVHNVCKWQEFSCFNTAVEAIFPGGGGTDLERGYGDVRPWRPPFHASPAARKGPISSKRVSSQDPLLRKFWNFSLYSLNFHPNLSSHAPKFGNFQLTSPQIWKFSAHKPPNLEISAHKPPFQRQMSVRKPHTSEIQAAHPYRKKSWVPPRGHF